MKRFLYAFLLLSGPLWATSLSELHTAAMDHHPDVAAAEASLSADYFSAREASAGFHPQLSVDMGTAYEDLDVRNEAYQYAYLTGRWNLYRGGRDLAARRLGESAIQIAHHQLCAIRQQILLEVTKAYAVLTESGQALAILDTVAGRLTEEQQIARKNLSLGWLLKRMRSSLIYLG